LTLERSPLERPTKDEPPWSRSDENAAIRRSVMHATLQFALGSLAVIRRSDHCPLEPEGTQAWLRNETR
jgi:hypothetical protein